MSKAEQIIANMINEVALAMFYDREVYGANAFEAATILQVIADELHYTGPNEVYGRLCDEEGIN